MLQVGGGFDFREETLGTDDCGWLRLEDLERHVTVVLQVLGEVHRRHPALTDLTLDAVAAFEGCVQAGDGIRSVQAPKMRLRIANRELAGHPPTKRALVT